MIKEVSIALKAKVMKDQLNVEKPLVLNSLPLCLIEMVYSLRIRYIVTDKVCLGYCGTNIKEEYLNIKDYERGNNYARIKKEACSDNLLKFYEKVYCFSESKGNPLGFSNEVFYRQKGSDLSEEDLEKLRSVATESQEYWLEVEKPCPKGKEEMQNEEQFQKRYESSKSSNELKLYRSEIVEKIAEIFLSKRIISVGEFKTLKEDKKDEIFKKIKEIDGIGDAGVMYLQALLGNESFCKPDTQLKNYVKEAFGKEPNLSAYFYNEIMAETVEMLRSEEKYKNLTVRQLDYMIWKKQRDESKQSNNCKQYFCQRR